MILVAKHRYRDLDLALVTFAWRGRALLAALDGPASAALDLGVARRFHSAGMPPPLIVPFSVWVSRGRPASITVASTNLRHSVCCYRERLADLSLPDRLGRPY
jgi:hypothetical protein